MKMLIVYSCCAFCTISQNSDLNDLKTLGFTTVPTSVTSLNAFKSFVEDTFNSLKTSQGFLNGYIPQATSTSLGLPTDGYFFTAQAVTTDVLLVIAYALSGKGQYELRKATGIWQSSWISFIPDSLNDLIKTKTYTYTYSVATNNQVVITGAQLGMANVTGYTPIGLRRYYTGAANAVPACLSFATGSETAAIIRNASSATSIENATLSVSYIFLKTSFYGGTIS